MIPSNLTLEELVTHFSSEVPREFMERLEPFINLQADLACIKAQVEELEETAKSDNETLNDRLDVIETIQLFTKGKEEVSDKEKLSLFQDIVEFLQHPTTIADIDENYHE